MLTSKITKTLEKVGNAALHEVEGGRYRLQVGVTTYEGTKEHMVAIVTAPPNPTGTAELADEERFALAKHFGIDLAPATVEVEEVPAQGSGSIEFLDLPDEVPAVIEMGALDDDGLFDDSDEDEDDDDEPATDAG